MVQFQLFGRLDLIVSSLLTWLKLYLSKDRVNMNSKSLNEHLIKESVMACIVRNEDLLSVVILAVETGEREDIVHHHQARKLGYCHSSVTHQSPQFTWYPS
jgi:hypothetical protein